MILNFGLQHLGLKLYKVCINDDLWLTLTYFTSLRLNVKNHYKVIKREKLAVNDQINRRIIFLKKKKLTPGGLCAPCSGAMYMTIIFSSPEPKAHW